MAYISKSRPRRTRGINFLLGGICVAAGFLVFAALGGSFGFGGGAPEVRIDPAGSDYTANR